MNHAKGYLIPIGGAEDKGDNNKHEDENALDFSESGTLKSVVDLMRKEPVIEVITTATSYPEESYENYKKAFTELGCVNVGHIDIRERSDTNNAELLERLRNCDGVMFSGGDQAKLSAILGGSEVIGLLKARYQNESFVVAGTSAGAAAMSSVMMYGGNVEKAYLKGEVTLSAGFGFINDVIIDTHFDARGRFARLAQAVATQPGIVGIGLGEDTGVIIKSGNTLRVIGSSSVTIIEGSGIFHNNIAHIADGNPISVGRLGVYILTRSDTFNLVTKEFIPVEDEEHQK